MFYRTLQENHLLMLIFRLQNMMGKYCCFIFCLCLITGCDYSSQEKSVQGNDSNKVIVSNDTAFKNDTLRKISVDTDLKPADIPKQEIQTVPLAAQLVAYAKTLVGTPYKYASTDPKAGFDCSGFITFVFNHFKIDVPRSSVDFTNYGKDISLSEAKEGDLVLFTGTDSISTIVGHMGIIVSNDSDKGMDFIHSTSGKANGVTITHFNDYYRKRFVKVIRVF